MKAAGLPCGFFYVPSFVVELLRLGCFAHTLFKFALSVIQEILAVSLNHVVFHEQQNLVDVFIFEVIIGIELTF